jgi:hypothetical protein
MLLTLLTASGLGLLGIVAISCCLWWHPDPATRVGSPGVGLQQARPPVLRSNGLQTTTEDTSSNASLFHRNMMTDAPTDDVRGYRRRRQKPVSRSTQNNVRAVPPSTTSLGTMSASAASAAVVKKQEGRLTAAEKESGLARMNRLRHDLVSLPATNALPASKGPVSPLVWDTRLESVAQEWADGCPSGHRPNNAYGENLAWSTRNDLVTSVDMWDAERANVDKSVVRKQGAAGFKFGTKQSDWCRGGWSACGHATQQLWAQTQRVGCARSTTPCTLQGHPVSLVVCNYDPPGNYQEQQVYPIA